jgi:hypothetical protein
MGRAALFVVIVLTTGMLSSPSATSAGPEADAGATARVGAWTLRTVYDDDFSGKRLHRGWSRYDGSYGSGVENHARPGHFKLNGEGQLVLLMKYRADGDDGANWYTGGAMLDEKYGGRFQSIDIRYKVVSNGVLSHRNIPMRWVDDPAYEWYEGESNYNEGSSLTRVSTFLHYGRNDQESESYSVDLTRWHRWRFVHRPDRRIRVFLDGKLKWDYRGTAVTVPDAFRRVVLQQEVSGGNPPTSESGSEQILVDHLRIKTFVPR